MLIQEEVLTRKLIRFSSLGRKAGLLSGSIYFCTIRRNDELSFSIYPAKDFHVYRPKHFSPRGS
jgi:hypothetical protein